MARTWHHGERNRARLFRDAHYCGAWPPRPTPPKQKRHARVMVWMRTPGWWIHEFMTVPERARTRNLIRYWLSNPDAEIIFSHPKRPHIYYY